MTNRGIALFQEKILRWYRENKRDLPWRQTNDPYAILISEVMLQQTQVARVVPKYEVWMKQFPTLASLSQATLIDVLRVWSGLGYNRRALYLQKTAQLVVRKRKGIFPQDEKELLKLPGIGPYTARAFLSFAFGKHTSVVDTNIRKVILTEVLHQNEAPQKTVGEWAGRLLPNKDVISSREWNQALMDYANAELAHKRVRITKQAPYKGSDRYYRGRVLQFLLDKKVMSLTDLRTLVSDTVKQDDERWQHIMAGLEKDGLLRYDGKHLTLVDNIAHKLRL